MHVMLSRLIVTGLVVLALLPALDGRAEAQAVDPQSLLGEWQGTWAWANNPGVNGQYRLNIKTVDGNRVQGRVERSNVKQGLTPDFNVTGSLTGNVLRFRAGETNTELTIDGNQMSGQMVGAARTNISLTKTK
jgi:hypothetical protein